MILIRVDIGCILYFWCHGEKRFCHKTRDTRQAERSPMATCDIKKCYCNSMMSNKKSFLLFFMMTSSNGSIFGVTGHLCGEFPSQRPVTRSFDGFFALRLNKRLSKQSWCWWFETPSRSLLRHCNANTDYGLLMAVCFLKTAIWGCGVWYSSALGICRVYTSVLSPVYLCLAVIYIAHLPCLMLSTESQEVPCVSDCFTTV